MSKNRSRVGFWVAIVVLFVLLMGSFLMNLGLIAVVAVTGSGNDVSSTQAVDEFPSFKERWSYGVKDKTKVVRIALQGPIMRGRKKSLFGSDADMVESILKQIRAATNDATVKGILLEINSPGGAVTPSDEIYTMLKRFKQGDPQRKVVVFIRDLGASGAYYVSMASDYIVAEPTAIVGSVGVIMQSMNMKVLSDKIGVKAITIASGKNKDMLNPFKEVNPEHRAMLQQLVDDMQNRFASIVVKARGLKSRTLLDGRVFTALDAKKNGFIDQVGYWSDSVAVLKKLLHVEQVYMVRYERKKGSFMEELFSAKGPNIPDLHLLQSTSPSFLYQWNP